MGTGAFARRPADSADYRRGYLCGMIRGDGHLGSYSYDRPGRTHGDVIASGSRSRTSRRCAGHAPTSPTPASRPTSSCFSGRGGRHRAMTAIRTPGARQGRPHPRSDRVAAVAARSTGARASSPGSSTPRAAYSGVHPRSANTDPEIIDWIDVLPAAARLRVTSSRTDPSQRTAGTCACAAGLARAAALLPHGRSRDHAQALDRRARRSSATPSSAWSSIEPLGVDDADVRHHHRHRRLHRQRRRQPQLLRPPHAHLPRLRRRPGLRARDRRQGQHARGAAGRADAAVLEARARCARDQHRSVPVGREALRADAGRLGGDAGLAHARARC